jgi:hypothetical protein
LSEHSLWNQLRTHLTPFGRLVRVENRCEPGTPDVAYCLSARDRVAMVSGWIELKAVKAPARPDTPVKFRELTLEQVVWLENWPGHAWLLARVDREYLLLRKWYVRRAYDGATLGQLRKVAAVHSGPRFPTAALLDALTGSGVALPGKRRHGRMATAREEPMR